MKKKFLFLLSLLLTIVACQKEDGPASYILQKGDIIFDTQSQELTTMPEGEIAVNVTSLSDEGITYLWLLEGDTISKEKNLKYIVNKAPAQYKLTLEVSQSKELSFDYPFNLIVKEIPAEDKIAIVSHNLHYNETQLKVKQSYWVNLANAADAEKAKSIIKWYVNNEARATGVTFDFTPEKAGSYTIKYEMQNYYSTNGENLSSEAISKTYSTSGVYILNEPNMTGSEDTRGINKHIFGEKTVTRFIVGDYNSFGASNQNIANWDGKLYNVAPYTQMGVAFSQFDATTGKFIKAIPSIAGQGQAFAGITPTLGVLTTTKGAYLVNLKDFTLGSESLKGSSNSKNIFVSDGYLFIVCSQGAIAYKTDSLSATTEPIVLGAATAGFVKSKDGMIWASNGNTLLRINPRDLTTSTVTLPDGAKIGFSANPWKQCSWAASTADNIFFFTKDSWGQSKEVYKYDIDSKELTSKFLVSADDFDGYNLYGTALYYDAERDELICQGMKGWGGDAAYNGIWGFNTKSGAKSFGVLYDTTTVPYLNMWFPAMMTPIKNY
jgi:hypothetical protein